MCAIPEPPGKLVGKNPARKMTVDIVVRPRLQTGPGVPANVRNYSPPTVPVGGGLLPKI